MNRGQIREYVATSARVIGNPDYPSTKLNAMIDLARKDMQVELMALGYKRWVTSASLTLSAGSWGDESVKTATLPSDLLEGQNSIRTVKTTNGSVSGFGGEVDDVKFLEALTNSFSAPDVTKSVYMRLGNTIYIAPSSTTAATIYYEQSLPALTSDSDAHGLPLEYESSLIKRVVMEIDAELGRLQDKQLALSEWKQNLADAYRAVMAKSNNETAVGREDMARLQ